MAMNEADTRANLIDPKLVAAGWQQIEHRAVSKSECNTVNELTWGHYRTMPSLSA